MRKARGGLGSLIPGAGLAQQGGAEMAPVESIAVNPYQPRRFFDEEALAELEESIRQHGLLQPLTVRPRTGGYELIAGERRLTAARRVGMREVPVIVRECGDDEMLMLALVENLQRENLNAMEAARSYLRLMTEFRLTQDAVAERVGKSRPAIANVLRLLSLPEHMQEAVEGGSISEGHGRALLAIGSEARREAAYRAVLEKGLSVRETEALASPPEARRARKRRGLDGQDAQLRALQEGMQSALGVRVRFRPGATLERGTLEVEYYSAEDLERVTERLAREDQ